MYILNKLSLLILALYYCTYVYCSCKCYDLTSIGCYNTIECDGVVLQLDVSHYIKSGGFMYSPCYYPKGNPIDYCISIYDTDATAINLSKNCLPFQKGTETSAKYRRLSDINNSKKSEMIDNTKNSNTEQKNPNNEETKSSSSKKGEVTENQKNVNSNNNNLLSFKSIDKNDKINNIKTDETTIAFDEEPTSSLAELNDTIVDCKVLETAWITNTNCQLDDLLRQTFDSSLNDLGYFDGPDQYVIVNDCNQCNKHFLIDGKDTIAIGCDPIIPEGKVRPVNFLTTSCNFSETTSTGEKKKKVPIKSVFLPISLGLGLATNELLLPKNNNEAENKKSKKISHKQKGIEEIRSKKNLPYTVNSIAYMVKMSRTVNDFKPLLLLFTNKDRAQLAKTVKDENKIDSFFNLKFSHLLNGPTKLSEYVYCKKVIISTQNLFHEINGSYFINECNRLREIIIDQLKLDEDFNKWLISKDILEYDIWYVEKSFWPTLSEKHADLIKLDLKEVLLNYKDVDCPTFLYLDEDTDSITICKKDVVKFQDYVDMAKFLKSVDNEFSSTTHIFYKSVAFFN